MEKGRIALVLTLCFAILIAGTAVAGKPEKPVGGPELTDATFTGDMAGAGQVYEDFYRHPSSTSFTMTLSGNLPAGKYNGTLRLENAGNRGRKKLVRVVFYNEEVDVNCCYGVWDKGTNPNLIVFEDQEAYYKINGVYMGCVLVNFAISLGS
jgi:hypothetical protein